MEKGLIEVFRIRSFDKTKTYAFAPYTHKVDDRYFTTIPLRHLGKYAYSQKWFFWDGKEGGAEYFDHNGHIERIEYDYDDTTCFVEVAMDMDTSIPRKECEQRSSTPTKN